MRISQVKRYGATVEDLNKIPRQAQVQNIKQLFKDQRGKAKKKHGNITKETKHRNNVYVVNRLFILKDDKKIANIFQM